MPERKPRKDAVRNRAAVLAAADALFAGCERPEAVTMADIAEAAGVGKATLFRAFGDRTGLIRALFETRLEPVRAAVEEGEPPLGPAAPPLERVPARSWTRSSASSSTTGTSPWRWREPGATAPTWRRTTRSGTTRSGSCSPRCPDSPTADSPPMCCSPPPVPTSSNISSDRRGRGASGRGLNSPPSPPGSSNRGAPAGRPALPTVERPPPDDRRPDGRAARLACPHRRPSRTAPPGKPVERGAPHGYSAGMSSPEASRS